MFAPVEVSKCRTCLQECSRYHHLEEYAENNLKIIEMLDAIVPQIPMWIPSQFSHLICGVCVDKLLNGYKFQQLCVESNKRLHSMLVNDEPPVEIKAETENSSDPFMQEKSAWQSECLTPPLSFYPKKTNMGENNLKMKQDLSDNIIMECEIKPEEITSYDACTSDVGTCGAVGAEDGDIELSNAMLAVFEAFEAFEGSETKKNLLNNVSKKNGTTKETECMKRDQHKIEPPKSISVEHTEGKVAQNTYYNNDDRITDIEATTVIKQVVDSYLQENEDSLDMEQESDNTGDEEGDYENSSKSNNIEPGIGAIQKPDFYNPRKDCVVCGKVFASPFRAKRHSAAVHSLNRLYACEFCTYRFSTFKLLKIHMTQHKTEGISTAQPPPDGVAQHESKPGGNANAQSPDDLTQEESKTSSNSTAQSPPDDLTQEENKTSGNSTAQFTPDGFKCPDCPRSFENKAIFSAHCQIHTRSVPEANFSCTVCNSNFLSERSLIGHIINKHPEVERHKCDQCDKSFVMQTRLEVHLNRHKDYKRVCLICGQKFYHSIALKWHHKRVHSNDNESSALCPQCGKTFKNIYGLKQHMMRHVGLKKYQCPECPTRFNCSSDLCKHMSTHKKSKPHMCDVCGLGFSRSYTLLKHKSQHNRDKTFICTVCKMTFGRIDILRKHMRTHTGEKPYKCKYCERAYSESSDLIKHLRTHVGENIYMCDQCPLAFKYKSELRQHVSEHYRTAQMKKISEES